MLAAEGLLGHQHANSGWGTFDDDNMVGATAFMETLELAVELRRSLRRERRAPGVRPLPVHGGRRRRRRALRAAVGLHLGGLGPDRRRGLARGAVAQGCRPRLRAGLRRARRLVPFQVMLPSLRRAKSERGKNTGSPNTRQRIGATEDGIATLPPADRLHCLKGHLVRMTVLVGLDVGTTGAKAVASPLEGEVVARAEHGYPLSTPRPGWSEQDPEHWWQAAEAALAEVSAGHAVAGIGLSGQMHGWSPSTRPTGSCGRRSSGTTSARRRSAKTSRRPSAWSA